MSGKFLRMLILAFVIEIFKIGEINLLVYLRPKYSLCIIFLSPRRTPAHPKCKLIRFVQTKWNQVTVFGKKMIKSNSNHRA